MKLFGTDGIRGRYPDELTPDLFTRLGKILAGIISDSASNKLVLGHDARQVSEMALSDIYIGLNADSKNQIDIQYVDVAATPLIAYIAKEESCWGLAVTASHNLHPYTGAKVFMSGGKKLDASLSVKLDNLLQSEKADAGIKDETTSEPTSEPKVELIPDTRPHEKYLAFLSESIEGRNLEGISVLIDAANGATSPLLPMAIENLGAEVSVICAEPDGTNINQECGSTNPQRIMSEIKGQSQSDQFDIGLMLDGDGDRLLACLPSKPRLIDGDEILAILALDMFERGLLKNNSVVATVMSNQGFINSMESHSISVIITQVGDQNVSDAMAESGSVLGGEDSGHTIFSQFSMHGDGLLTAIQLLDALKRSGRSLDELLNQSMEKVPQVVLNAEVLNAEVGISAEIIMDALKTDIQKVQEELGQKGRVLVRPSGTEPVIRVLVEAETVEIAQNIAQSLVNRIVELNTKNNT